jgi:zinc transport system ATP-binding protein
MAPILQVKGVSVEFEKGKKVLDKVSFEIEKGDLVSLIGLNGAGKTVLLKTIIGLITPSEGHVKRHTDNIFYIPQKSDLDMSFPLNVADFCELFGAKDYKKYIDAVGMTSFLRAAVSDLSGGEYQRVLIAIALSRKPDLLLLDEPVSGIDLVGESSFYALIEEIRKEYDLSLLIVSHNIHLVIKNSDKVLCLANHLCCTGVPAVIKESEAFMKMFGNYLQPYTHKHDHPH